jgi:hypothetical protein
VTSIDNQDAEGNKVIERLERPVIYTCLAAGVFGLPIAAALKLEVPTSIQIWALTAALLGIFRLADKRSYLPHPTLQPDVFSNAIRSTTENSASGQVDIEIFANDGEQYYSFLCQATMNIGRLSLLLCDLSKETDWRSLKANCIVRDLEIRKSEPAPALHYLRMSDGHAMLGLFSRRMEAPDRIRIETQQCFSIESRSEGGHALVSALEAHFKREWVLATELHPNDQA